MAQHELILGTHPGKLTVRLVRTDGATLVASLTDATGELTAWPETPRLEFAAAANRDVVILALDAEVMTSTALWVLTDEQVEAIALASRGQHSTGAATLARITMPESEGEEQVVRYAGKVDWRDSWSSGGKTQRITLTIPGQRGPRGESAYEVAVANGFVGTEEEWLESLVEKGEPYDDTAITQALADETVARTAGDEALQDDLASEAQARTAADTALGEDITDEAMARAAADETLQDNIIAEAQDRTEGDAALSAALAAQQEELDEKANGDALLYFVDDLQAQVNTKADLVGGLVPTSQIPSVALTNGQAVANRAAMLALNVQGGDIAVITGGADKGTYILKENGNPATFADWILLNAPTDVVQTVNGQQGTVVLGAADVGADPAGSAATAQTNAINAAATDATTKANAAQTAAQAASTPVAHATATNNPHSVTKAQVGLSNVDNTSDSAKPISTAQQAALDTLTGATGAVSITNLKTNGDLGTGDTTGWTASNANLAVSGGVLQVTPTAAPTGTATVQHAYQSYALINGNIYYGRARLKGATTLRLQITTQVIGAVTVADTWQTFSGLHTAGADHSRAFGVRDVAASDWTTAEVDNAIFINLTATFGAGNEPTLAEMDYIIDQFFAGYPNGTVTLTLKNYLAMVSAFRTAQVDVFTANGTWTKPSWAKTVEVIAIGAGGGGGSGARQAAAAAAGGGGGGGGGGFTTRTFLAADLGATAAVGVGAGGTGGAAQTIDSTAGVAGTAGTTTTFAGSALQAVRGTGGGGGGLAANGTAGGGGAGMVAGGNGGTGTSGSSGAAGAASNGGGGCGAGGGGGLSASNGFSGNNGGVPSSTSITQALPGGASLPGGDGKFLGGFVGGIGAAGGGAGVTAAGGNGGAGTGYGCGGGGGGAARNGFDSGAGGRGGPGLCVVISRA